jgi:catechol 2,3-dioxygenase-like lactoylglutathione lyase family enzyme
VKRTDTPRVFRVLLPARDLEQSRRFYESLLSTSGRVVAPGRIYFDCGPILLGILDYSSAEAAKFSSPTEALYFATADLAGVHRRARKLGCLSPGLLHDDPSSPLGSIVVRPWGERSFYADDPSGNPLCFVDAKTLFTGTPRQVEALERGPKPRSHARLSAHADRSESPRRTSRRS